MAVKISGTGSQLPANKVSNVELAKFVDTSDEWIRERTGIGNRHISKGETVADLATKACINALENANKKAEEIELIMVATCSPEMALPCAACQVQSNIGATNAVAFDLNAACSGFMFALNTAYAYIQAGIYKSALIAGAEVLSKILDWEDRTTCILFGDGAGAVVLEKSDDDGGVIGFVQHADGAKGSVLACENREVKNPYHQAAPGIKYVNMDGREVFAFATRQVPISIKEVLSKTELSVDDIDIFILHQANARIIEVISKRLGAPIEKFPMNLFDVGNMSSASLPVLLDQLNREGKIEKGMKIVLSGFGAGLTYGACVIEW